jgi:hypothetical protein
VEKTDLSAVPGTAQAGKGVRVMVKGQPESEEVIPLAALKESINKAAYGYTGKWLGPKEEVGNLPAPPACRRATADRRYRLARQAGKGGSLPACR